MEASTVEAVENRIEQLTSRLSALRSEIAKRIVGQEKAVEDVLLCLLTDGHGLLEGVPGLAKTMLIRTLADALELDFSRIQFTPDLMPGDITGTEVIEEDRSTGRRVTRFLHGPVFTQVLLADEINRPPQDTGGAARGDAGRARHGGRDGDGLADAILPARDSKSDRAGGYIPSA